MSRRVLFLGGSVMWGYTVPDSLTIPSLVMQRLRERGDSQVEIRNLAQPSYNATQGLITLMLELRAGYRPDVVISLDGNNDVLAAQEEGHAGAAFGEGDLARQSAVGARGFWASVAGLVRYSALLRRLGRAAGPARVGQGDAGHGAACDSIGLYYGQVVSEGEALGRQFGFRTIYLWQPHWATTRKRLSPWEQTIAAAPGLPGLLRACDAAVESLMTARRDSGFVSLTPLFDADTIPIFLDEFGHMTPAGHQRVADRIADMLTTRLAPR